MANMSYCRFQNTLSDMRDCQTALEEGDKLSEYELRACGRLLLLCRNMADTYLSEDGDMIGVNSPSDGDDDDR